MENYSIKLDRAGGLHPGDIPAWKLAKLLDVLSKQFADSKNDFCLTGLADNCIRLDFKICSPKMMTSIVMFSALLSGQLIASDSQIYQYIEEFDRVRSNLFPNISMTFPAVNEYPAVTLPFDRKLSDIISNKPEIQYQHTIYGKVINVGGERPNIHIRPLGGGPNIICECSEELAAQAGSRLYLVVGIAGKVTHSTEPIRMKAERLLPYQEPKRNPFTLLKEAGISKYFEDESVADFMRKIRGDDGDDNA